MHITESTHDHAHEHNHDHHGIPLQEAAKTALLIGLGLYLVYIIASGNLTNYVNVYFAWLSYIAAALFLLLGAASAFHLRRLLHHDHNAHDHHAHNHLHGTLSWPAIAVIAIPLVLGTLLPSQPLGAAAVDGDFNTMGYANTVTSDIAPADRNILDWVRAFNVAEDATSFNGLEANVIGFVFRGDAYKPDQFMVARFAISCCVADAVAIGIPVIWQADIPADTWVQVRGHLQVGDFQGEEQPILFPDTVAAVPRPEHPYLYP